MIRLAAALALGFALPAQAVTYRQIHVFGMNGDGATPFSGLTLAGNTLYGTLYSGGTGAQGAIYTIDPATGAETILHAFAGPGDGAGPAGSLLLIGRKLFGTTAAGGHPVGHVHGYGTIYAIDTRSGRERILFRFPDTGAAGKHPASNLTNIGPVLFGTTQSGGPGDSGVVFSFNTATNAFQVLHAFAGGAGDGCYPAGNGLTVAGGLLYGLATSCGALGSGTIYSIDPATGAEKTLYSFTGGNGAADGRAPAGELAAAGGTLFGVTSAGGPGDAGTVFAFNPATSAETVLYAFPVRNNHAAPLGAVPAARLLPFAGRLWGTAEQGGPPGSAGVVFSVNPASGRVTLEHAFTPGNGADGAIPTSPLLAAGGTLFGSTSRGGSSNLGTVFAITP